MILAVTLDAVISANHMIRNRIDFDALGGAIFMFLVTIAVILFVYAGTQDSKYNIERYNLMHDHNSQTYKNDKKIGVICGSIMMVATMIFLGCGFLGNLWHSAWVVYPDIYFSGYGSSDVPPKLPIAGTVFPVPYTLGPSLPPTTYQALYQYPFP